MHNTRQKRIEMTSRARAPEHHCTSFLFALCFGRDAHVHRAYLEHVFALRTCWRTHIRTHPLARDVFIYNRVRRAAGRTSVRSVSVFVCARVARASDRDRLVCLLWLYVRK